MTNRKRTEKGHGVEKLILTNAMRIFREDGYDNFRMATLAKSVDMPIGAISYYFPKKTDILQKIYTEYDTKIYELLSQYDWFNDDTSLFQHISSSIIFYTNILNDPASRRFFVEVAIKEVFSEFYYTHIREKYDSFLNDYDISISEEKFKACILLDFGSRREFWTPYIRNEIQLDTSDALRITLNLMPLLLGIDHKEMSRIYIKAFEQLTFIDYSKITLI